MNNNKSSQSTNRLQKNKPQVFISDFTVILIALIFLAAVLFNIFIVEFEKYATGRALRQQTETAAILSKRLEKIKEELAKKDEETSQLINFHDSFLPLWRTYHNSIKLFSAESTEKPESVHEIKKFIDKRLELSKKYLIDFEGLKLPDVLLDFYNKNIAFINSDIKFWEAVNNYYNIRDLKEADTQEIEKLANESKKLYKEAVDTLKEIYNLHDLSYFLKEYE